MMEGEERGSSSRGTEVEAAARFTPRLHEGPDVLTVWQGETPRTMLQALVSTAGRWLNDLNRSWRRGRVPLPEVRPPSPAAKVYGPLRRVVLTDEVSRTLFEEYIAHRKSARGEEETGWLLLGLREENKAVVLATLPAGTQCDAGVSHVQFNSGGQALGSRIVRQTDRRLTMLGVVHTHPGSLRHPSDGDYRGDSQWVGQLRGGEAIFGIGTADGDPDPGTQFGKQLKPHVQGLGELCFSWYALGDGDRTYRPLPYELTLGPDLARPLHSIWAIIEAHAERLDRVCRQQAGVTFEVVEGEQGPALAMNVPLAERGDAVRVYLEDKEIRYYLNRDGDLLAADPQESRVDRGVYLLLAELAAQG